MKPVGIYGGSFDPVHLGHIITSRILYEKRDLEKIIFVPNRISPLKQNKMATPVDHRFNMLKLALESFSYCEVSDYEILKSGISYTYDTVCHFKNMYDKIELIIGYDNLILFEQWHKPDDILEMVKLVVMKRKIDKEQARNRFFDRSEIIDTPTIEISSTEIRERVKNNLSIEYLVPKKVKEYISENRLYI